MKNDSTNHECEEKFLNAFILRKYDIKFRFMLIDLIDASLSTLHDKVTAVLSYGRNCNRCRRDRFPSFPVAVSIFCGKIFCLFEAIVHR